MLPSNTSTSHEAHTGQSSSEHTYLSEPFDVFGLALRAQRGNNIINIIFLYLVQMGGFAGFAVVAAILLAIGLSAGSSADTSSVGAAAIISIVVVVLLYVLLAIASLLLWQRYAVSAAREEKVAFSDVLKSLKRLPGYAAVVLLTFFAVVGGLLLFIVPGIILGLWFYLAPYVYLDQPGIGPIQAMKKSKQLVHNKMFEQGGVLIAGSLLYVPVGVPVVGWLWSLVVLPLVYTAIAYRYVSATRLEKAGATKPATHQANFWLAGILVAPLIAIIFYYILMLMFVVVPSTISLLIS